MRAFVTRLVLMAASFAAAESVSAQARVQRVVAVDGADLSGWSERLSQMVAAGSLRLAWSRDDTLLPGRLHERFQQLHGGVPVFGGELVRQSAAGQTLSVFGTLYSGITIGATPRLTSADARRVVEARPARPFGSQGTPELMVVAVPDGRYVLAYKVRAWQGLDIRLFFVDAASGAVAWDFSDLETQAMVGSATGVLGDKKKMSVTKQGSSYVAQDELRPPAILTFDFDGDLNALLDTGLQAESLPTSRLASDADDVWTDGANVDAHAQAGYVYDYYYRRFGRRGLDNANITMRNVTHPVNRNDLFFYGPDVIGLFYLNAFYAGDGLMVYGEGLPPDLTDPRGRHWNYVAGALDVCGHELTHGVTAYTSRLIYQNESAALNEGFSDIMGTSVEFFYQPPGNGPLHADYLIGEDVITGGLRSLSNPLSLGDPDNYSIRFTGPEDNGGAHINCTIAGHAYYLAIEGGTNRTSGIKVKGVGAENREQIERVYYRAFTAMLPANANFSVARAVTIQSARDLYGAGSPAESAVTQAWTAVGVQ